MVSGWAKSGDLNIAYEVHGTGPVDIVEVPGLVNTLVGSAQHRSLSLYDERRARFARLIKLDRRGTGLSDRLPAEGAPTIEERIDDVRAVMDEVGSERACVMATGDGGPIGVVFAATYPQRVASLVLSYATPCFRWTPDFPWGASEEDLLEVEERLSSEWGTGVMAPAFGMTTDEQRAQMANLERVSCTPAAAAAAFATNHAVDVRDVLPTVSVPTLVVLYRDFSVWPLESSRYLAEHIPGARLLEVDGSPENFAGTDAAGSLPEIEEFITGQRAQPEIDRVLKSILFTDIVGSTDLASRVGDARWRELLDAHDAAIRDALERFRGEEIVTTGDGFFAAFDGPARAIRCAQAILTESRKLELDVRAGIHTGECELRGDDLAGIAVHIGARVAALADGGEVLVTSTVRDLVAGSGIVFEDRGTRELKGVPGEWQVLAAVPD